MTSVSSAPDLTATHVFLERGGVRLYVRRNWESAVEAEALLAGAPLEEWGAQISHSLRGRGEVHLLGTPRGEIVAKRLSRGGMIGALFRESYVDPDRPVREAALAEALAAAGCRTPPVVIVRSTRRGLGMWRLELATARVADGRDLLDVLRDAHRDGTQVAALAQRVGSSLAGLHAAGLEHRDLQVKNLLVTPGEGALVVLDLDRCELRPPLSELARAESLLRFLRSLAKQGLLPRRGAAPEPAFAEALLEGIARGYDLMATLGWGLPELRRRLRREVGLRAMLWGAVEL